MINGLKVLLVLFLAALDYILDWLTRRLLLQKNSC